MWTSEIFSKQKVNDKFIVVVKFINGTESFTESIDMTGGTAEVLARKVASRLATLNDSDTLEPQVSVGAYTPNVPTDTALAFKAAIKRLTSLKRAVDLGLITTASPVYVQGVAAVQAAFDPSFIDLL
jgi:hypothetical protein